jgi:hypothetical protein
MFVTKSTPTQAGIDSESSSKLCNKTSSNNLVNLALKTLPRMIVPGANMFCGELHEHDLTAAYTCKMSARYTIISLLGLARARASKHNVAMDIDAVYLELGSYENALSPGDLGLQLWLDHRLGSRRAELIVNRLRNLLRSSDWHKIVTMELAWILTGLTQHNYKSGQQGDEITDSLVRYLLGNRSAPCGLFYHLGNGMRRRFPNFASQIYTIHALSMRARLAGDERSGERAMVAAQRLSNLQRANGGWPWLYDVERGEVVEPFEIYSVHQDAMAPMAFHELCAATGVDTSDTVNRGLKWLYRENELGANMIDTDNGLIFRSIRRKSVQARASLYWRTLMSVSGVSLHREPRPSSLEINPTCRPYHLGWMLEAWC